MRASITPVRPARRARLALSVAAVAIVAMCTAMPTSGANSVFGFAVGFKTSQASMITPVAAGVTADPIMTVGENIGGYKFEAIPDGISLQGGGFGLFDAYVNHETSTVPFPAGVSDFQDSQVSRLTMTAGSPSVIRGHYAINSSANFHRFCSNFLATQEHGFETPIFFTGEEASDFVNREGNSWPPGPNAEQAGVAVALSPAGGMFRAGFFKPIYGMGRMNHENEVAIPGYGHPVVLTDDDTFNAPSSQLYMYTAASAAAVWNDAGTLWAFKSDVPTINDYSDMGPTTSVSGEFIPVPRAVAVGDQTGLENWSNANNVFQFIRLEDIAYDRNTPNVVYLADTGEPRALPGPGTARMTRGPSGTQGPFPNGRVFKLVLDPTDETNVLSLSILINAEPLGAASAGVVGLLHNPDNLETTENSLLIQEDPGAQNQYAANNPAGTTARIWLFNLTTGAMTVVARVNQAQDPAAAQGNWESSGIVDASAFYGDGAFLVDVQAHSLFVDTLFASGTLFKREGGQLLLLRVPGA